MIKFIANLLELYLIAWFGFRTLRFIGKMMLRKVGLGKSKKSRGKKRLSISRKVGLLVSRQLHYMLNGMLKRQSMYLKKKKESLVNTNAQQDSKEKVIQFSKYQSKVVK